MKKNNTKVLIIFLIFFILVLFQHHFMWLYHDDYGYASLSYVGNVYKTSFLGYKTNLIDILNFCKYHYMNWGGRILYFFIECIMLRFGMHLFRIVQSLVITGIFFYIYKIVSCIVKKEDWKIAVMSVSLYGLFEILLFRNGIFWITASVLYLFPFLPFFMYIYYFVLKYKKKHSVGDYIISCLLVLFAAFSQEQISAMVVAFIFMYGIYMYLTNHKRIDFQIIINFVFSLLGFAILMLSPGSKARMSMTPEFYDLSLFEKLKVNIPSILFNNFGGYTRMFSLLFLAVGVYFAFSNYRNKKNCLNISALVSNGTVFIFSVLKYDVYFSWLYNYKSIGWFKIIAMIVIFINLALLAYSIIYYFIKENNFIIPILFIASLGSQAVMLMAPYFSLRCAMVMQFIDFIIILYALSKLLMKNNKQLFIIPLVVVCLFNYSEITYGYYKNDANNRYNHEKLLEVRDKIKNGELIDRVVLKKMINIAYANDEPYEENRSYIKTYMRAYYQLPEDFIIDYE